MRYKGKNIYEVLDMTVDEACEFFANVPKDRTPAGDHARGRPRLRQARSVLHDALGRRSAARQLATELSKRSTGRTIYILDEPTTGLPCRRCPQACGCPAEVGDAGNTVVVIEHNLDVIKTADYILDLGPRRWWRPTGRLRTPERLHSASSYTGQYSTDPHAKTAENG